MLKNVFILGDSYSTFSGHIPVGYSPYYNSAGPWHVRTGEKAQLDENDVTEVSQTWWYNLINENGNLLRNCSYSGTTICNTGYDGCDNSHISFIARMNKLIEEGFFKENKVDTFFLFGGTNDSWSDAPIGNPIHSDWTKEDLYCVLPAFSYIINLLIKTLPDTKIYCILNDGLKEEINEFYKHTCKENNIPLIELHDIDKDFRHPTIKGMAQIKEQVYNFIKANN